MGGGQCEIDILHKVQFDQLFKQRKIIDCLAFLDPIDYMSRSIVHFGDCVHIVILMMELETTMNMPSPHKYQIVRFAVPKDRARSWKAAV